MSAAQKEDVNSPFVTLMEHEETKEMGINALNDDCLTHIMQYLPIVDRVRIERVCKRWRAASLDAWRGFKNLNFTNECWGFSAPETLAEVNHSIIKKILKRCGKFLSLIEFKSEFDGILDQNILESVARFCPKIQHLDIWRLPRGSPKNWRALSETCSKLVFLAVSDCKDYELSSLFENNKELKTLYLIYCDITGECLKKLNCYSIERIVFVECTMITLDNFHVVRDFCNLKQLVLDEHQLDNGFMEDISARYKTLTYLTLVPCFHGTSYSLSQIAMLINLRVLDLSENVSVDDELLVSIGTNCKLLKEVNIRYCFEVTNTGLASIVSLPHLESLLIEALDNIDDQVFCAMPTLRQMDCSDCTNMRDAGLIKLIEGSENLEHLYLEDCGNVSNELLEAAIRAMKKRSNQALLKLHLGNKDVERLKANDTPPFLPIFSAIIDRCSRPRDRSELSDYYGRYLNL